MDTIESAAERLDCNKTKAVLLFCEVVGDVLDGVEDALEHPDLPPSVAEELAETISTRRIMVRVNTTGAEVEIE